MSKQKKLNIASIRQSVNNQPGAVKYKQDQFNIVILVNSKIELSIMVLAVSMYAMSMTVLSSHPVQAATSTLSQGTESNGTLPKRANDYHDGWHTGCLDGSTGRPHTTNTINTLEWNSGYNSGFSLCSPNVSGGSSTNPMTQGHSQATTTNSSSSMSGTKGVPGILP